MATETVDVDPVSPVVEEEAAESDDFGSFSDASFENGTDQEDEVHNEIAQYLDELLPDCGVLAQPDDSQPVALEQLLQDERPQVIYEQLVELRTGLQPLSWDKSHLKANLWHILRIPEDNKAEKEISREEPLDDSLYRRLMPLLKDTNIHTVHLLRDQFKMNYTAPLTPIVVHDEEEKDQERAIPSLLAKKVDADGALTEYHDALCHAIDVLFVELHKLMEREAALRIDKTTFENVITNLTGHTQRLYRDEVALYNKRIKRRSKFSWSAK